MRGFGRRSSTAKKNLNSDDTKPRALMPKKKRESSSSEDEQMVRDLWEFRGRKAQGGDSSPGDDAEAGTGTGTDKRGGSAPADAEDDTVPLLLGEQSAEGGLEVGRQQQGNRGNECGGYSSPADCEDDTCPLLSGDQNAEEVEMVAQQHGSSRHGSADDGGGGGGGASPPAEEGMPVEEQWNQDQARAAATSQDSTEPGHGVTSAVPGEEGVQLQEEEVVVVPDEANAPPPAAASSESEEEDQQQVRDVSLDDADEEAEAEEEMPDDARFIPVGIEFRRITPTGGILPPSLAPQLPPQLPPQLLGFPSGQRSEEVEEKAQEEEEEEKAQEEEREEKKPRVVATSGDRPLKIDASGGARPKTYRRVPSQDGGGGGGVGDGGLSEGNREVLFLEDIADVPMEVHVPRPVRPRRPTSLQTEVPPGTERVGSLGFNIPPQGLQIPPMEFNIPPPGFNIPPEEFIIPKPGLLTAPEPSVSSAHPPRLLPPRFLPRPPAAAPSGGDSDDGGMDLEILLTICQTSIAPNLQRKLYQTCKAELDSPEMQGVLLEMFQRRRSSSDGGGGGGLCDRCGQAMRGRGRDRAMARIWEPLEVESTKGAERSPGRMPPVWGVTGDSRPPPPLPDKSTGAARRRSGENRPDSPTVRADKIVEQAELAQRLADRRSADRRSAYPSLPEEAEGGGGGGLGRLPRDDTEHRENLYIPYYSGDDLLSAPRNNPLDLTKKNNGDSSEENSPFTGRRERRESSPPGRPFKTPPRKLFSVQGEGHGEMADEPGRSRRRTPSSLRRTSRLDPRKMDLSLPLPGQDPRENDLSLPPPRKDPLEKDLSLPPPAREPPVVVSELPPENSKGINARADNLLRSLSGRYLPGRVTEVKNPLCRLSQAESGRAVEVNPPGNAAHTSQSRLGEAMELERRSEATHGGPPKQSSREDPSASARLPEVSELDDNMNSVSGLNSGRPDIALREHLYIINSVIDRYKHSLHEIVSAPPLSSSTPEPREGEDELELSGESESELYPTTIDHEKGEQPGQQMTSAEPSSSPPPPTVTPPPLPHPTSEGTSNPSILSPVTTPPPLPHPTSGASTPSARESSPPPPPLPPHTSEKAREIFCSPPYSSASSSSSSCSPSSSKYRDCLEIKQTAAGVSSNSTSSPSTKCISDSPAAHQPSGQPQVSALEATPGVNRTVYFTPQQDPHQAPRVPAPVPQGGTPTAETATPMTPEARGSRTPSKIPVRITTRATPESCSRQRVPGKTPRRTPQVPAPPAQTHAAPSARTIPGSPSGASQKFGNLSSIESCSPQRNQPRSASSRSSQKSAKRKMSPKGGRASTPRREKPSAKVGPSKVGPSSKVSHPAKVSLPAKASPPAKVSPPSKVSLPACGQQKTPEDAGREDQQQHQHQQLGTSSSPPAEEAGSAVRTFITTATQSDPIWWARPGVPEILESLLSLYPQLWALRPVTPSGNGGAEGSDTTITTNSTVTTSVTSSSADDDNAADPKTQEGDVQSDAGGAPEPSEAAGVTDSSQKNVSETDEGGETGGVAGSKKDEDTQ